MEIDANGLKTRSSQITCLHGDERAFTPIERDLASEVLRTGQAREQGLVRFSDLMEAGIPADVVMLASMGYRDAMAAPFVLSFS